MRVPYSTAAYTYLNFSEVFQDYYNAPPADVTFRYQTVDKVNKEIDIPNAAKLAAMFGTFNGREFIFGTVPPALNIDPDYTGTIYIESDVGNMYICTDNTPSANVWKAVISTFDINDIKSQKATLSAPAGVVENTNATITITNHNPSYNYIFTTVIGAILYNYGDNHATFHAPNVIANTSNIITAKVIEPGMLISDTATVGITVTDSGGGVPPGAEQIINNDLAANQCASYM